MKRGRASDVTPSIGAAKRRIAADGCQNRQTAMRVYTPIIVTEDNPRRLGVRRDKKPSEQTRRYRSDLAAGAVAILVVFLAISKKLSILAESFNWSNILAIA